MAFRFNDDAKNYIINQGIVKQLAGTMGTGGTATLYIYTGSQPDSANDAPSGTSGTLLCTIINIGWGGSNGTRGATCGTIAFGTSGGYTGTAVADGTAGWGRFQRYGTGFTGSAATFRVDGDVGVAGTCTFVIDSVEIATSGLVNIQTFNIAI